MLLIKRPHQCGIFQNLSVLMKVHSISHPIFETRRSGFIQILHHCSMSWKITPFYFLAETSYFLTKIAHRSEIFGLFSIMKHDSSVFFHLNPYILWIKGSDQSAYFQTFDCLHENWPNSLCHISSHKSVFL